MKKKFLNLLFTPLLITPIIASSCADTNNIAAQSFTYESNKYQLYIVPVAGNDNSYTTANVLIRLKYAKDPNHKEDEYDNQYIGDITVNDSYTNKDNGYSYKTNIVSFDVSEESYDTKVKYTTDVSTYKYVQYYITNFTVNGNSYTTAQSDKILSDNLNKNREYHIYVTGLTTMNVNIFNNTLSGLFDKTNNINFSNRLNRIDRFGIFCYPDSSFNLKLPNSLKVIKSTNPYTASFQGTQLSQNEFIIPQSVEEIGDESFAYLDFTNNSSNSSNEKSKVKMPTKFKPQEANIFEDYQNKMNNNFDIEYY